MGPTKQWTHRSYPPALETEPYVMFLIHLISNFNVEKETREKSEFFSLTWHHYFVKVS